MVESRSSLAIVLRWRSYGESDKIVTLLTRDFGKLTGIGKGAKNSRRRFANSLEPLARVRVYFRQRPGASLAFLESCDLLGATTFEPTRFAYGSYLAELTEQLTVEWNPVANVYDLLETALGELDRGPASASFLRGFELQLLAAAGFAPQLEHCNRCTGELPEDRVSFSPALGTFWCASCAGKEEGLTQIDTSVVASLATLRHRSLAECRATQLGEAEAAAAQLTGQLLAIQLGRPLRSLRLIAQLEA
jgi:DNA repair protein RecO (recombination protein O)